MKLFLIALLVMLMALVLVGGARWRILIRQ